MNVSLPGFLPDPDPDDLVGGYRIVRLLGKGGMAIVFEARPEGGGETRALKLMASHAMSDEVRTRFEREYRALSQLDHPRVMRVFETGMHGNRPFYVMELLEGRDLRAEMETWRDLPVRKRFQRAEAILVQTCEALAHIHARGFVHRDISPSNLMIVTTSMDAAEDELRVKLMDFGVVREPGTDLTLVDEMVGTVAYMAPEQFTAQPIDERADLYSLGVILYTMLTGTRPFQARNVAGYIDRHLHQAPRPPREILPAIPRYLEDACLRLLAKDPADRFASASHLLHFISGAESAAMEGPHGGWPRRTMGRAAEIAWLREAVSQLATGHGGVILLEGASGSGKTRLLDEVAASAEGHGLLVGRGQCRSGRPFSGYAKIYDVLTRQRGFKPVAAMRRVFEVDELTAAPPERYAVFAGFLDILRRSGTSVLLIDDIHRADRGTLELTEYLIRNLLGLAGEPVLIVLTRLEVKEDADPFAALIAGEATGVPLQLRHLEPLSALAVEDLLLDLVPGDPNAPRLALQLHEKSDGNPHFVVEMIRALWDERIIVAGPDRRLRLRTDIDAVLDAGLPVPPSIRDALRERLQPLPPDARLLAATLAISRQELGLDLLCAVTGRDPEDLPSLMTCLSENGIVRTRRLPDGERHEIAGAALRDVVLDDLGESERRHLHRRLGTALERIGRRRTAPVVDVLAWHFEQGQVPSKAFPYLLRTGEQLLAQSFVSEALEALNRALRIEPAAREYLVLDEAERLLATVLLQRSRAYAHLGRWDEAEADALAASRIAQELRDPRLVVLTGFEVGASHRRRTNLDKAEEAYREALLAAERIGDATLRVTALGRIGELHWARGNLEAARRCWVEVLALGETTRDQRSLGAGYNGLGLLAMYRGQSAEARKHLDQACKVYEELGALGELLNTRINLIELFHLTGNLRKGLSLADKTVAQAREIHHREGIAVGLRFRALILTDLGRTQEACAHAEEALAMARELGGREEELACYASLVRIAMVSDLRQEAEPWIEKALPLLQRYDTEGVGKSLLAWSARLKAGAGDEGDALRDLDRAERYEGRRWPVQMVRYHIVAAETYHTLGQPLDARAQAHAALDIAEMAGFRFYTFKAHALLVLAADHLADGAQHRRIALALLRSLAANLNPDEADRFLDFHMREWAQT